ncbi:diguanylate cyclase [filamentous cyanobacterium LEGE 11480]|uniref:Diguanylate cyclase n=1 Tax=Romeriopsis navalis LEGE 11480 TaxID=2777977 RepID=A0A928VUH7_9CYAN|nr:diguanylate cyclase [Romeriopsis navalis]MBE9032304.1 diguanylate cyclase [Romeriopsis navalis LEGE 11480]
MNSTALLPIVESNIPTFPPDTPVQFAIDAMVRVNMTCVLVVRSQRLVGIFTERDLTRGIAAKIDFGQLLLRDVMVTAPLTVQIEDLDDIFKISQQFLQHHVRHLPVIDHRQQVLGIITPQSLRNRFKPEYLLRNIRVGEVMMTDVLRAAVTDSVMSVVQLMSQHRVSCIVIVDPHNQAPLGVITERDVARLHGQHPDLDVLPVAQVMSQPLALMWPQNSLWEVHQRMQSMHVRRLVISHATGELAGIVTQTQMLKLMDPMEVYQVMGQMQSTIDQQTGELRQLNQALTAANRNLQRLSTIDELTQVANRRHFNQYLAQVLHRATFGQSSTTTGWPRTIALLLADVDHFKAYNDTYGHVAGDHVLFEIAQALQSITRHSQDLVARYGGEEFVVVLPDADLRGVERLGAAMLATIRELQIAHTGSPTYDYVTISIGVALIQPMVDADVDGLTKRADQALYQAKQNGRNCYYLYG